MPMQDDALNLNQIPDQENDLEDLGLGDINAYRQQ
jgi:hypothetical protein